MTFYNYAIEYEPAKSGRSQSYDLNCSYKDLTQVLGNLKGLPVAKAVKLIEECVEMKKAIPFKKFNTGMGHRSELGGKKGKYPKKEAKLALELLNNAVANAKSKGMDEKSLMVLHACAYKQNVFPRYRRFFASSTELGYGKQAMFSSYMTARAELVVGQKDAQRIEKSPRARAKENKRQKLESKTSKKTPAKAEAKAEVKKDGKAASSDTAKQETKVAEKKMEKSQQHAPHAGQHDHAPHEGHSHDHKEEKKTEAKV